MEQISREKIHAQLSHYPGILLQALQDVDRQSDEDCYLVGGLIRDLLLGKRPNDIDLTVSFDAHGWGNRLLNRLGGGALVELSSEEGQEACRVVWRGWQIDIAAFRSGADEITADLLLRDFSINAMAVKLADLSFPGSAPSSASVPAAEDSHDKLALYDPAGGLADLSAGVVRHLAGAFDDDPARLVRGYRFVAKLGFELAQETLQDISLKHALLTSVAPERVLTELDEILLTGRSAQILIMMHEAGLLGHLLPELSAADRVEQPDFHHLDVLGHSLLTLEFMDKEIADPTRYFPGMDASFEDYLSREKILALKWTALLHDIGKVPTRRIRENDGRVTFYSHDETGRRMVTAIGERLRWSRKRSESVGTLVAAHMHPFHLCNSLREGGDLSKKAALKLCHRVRDDLPGLMMQAMADSLASQGALKPEDMEAELVSLYRLVTKIYDEDIRPVWQGPRLLTGHDLISVFKLSPGPLFSEILQSVELAQVDGRVRDREQALGHVSAFLARKRIDGC